MFPTILEFGPECGSIHSDCFSSPGEILTLDIESTVVVAKSVTEVDRAAAVNPGAIAFLRIAGKPSPGINAKISCISGERGDGVYNVA